MAMYSHSKISCFGNCPLQFKFRYIDRKKPDFKNSIEAFLGSMVHDSLELLHTEKQMGKTLTLDYLLDYYISSWKDKWNDEIKVIKKDRKAEEYFNLGIGFIKDYYNKYQPFDHGKDIGIEEKILIQLNSRHNIIGYIDRLTIVDNTTYEIHDYKTGASLPEQRYLDSDRQLALYMIAILEKFPSAEKVELVWHYLAFDKEMRSTRTREQLEILKIDIIRKIDMIESAKDYPPKESALCNWCVYQSYCPLKNHQNRLENIPKKGFSNDDGAQLVNRCIELKDKKKEIEDELDSLKSDLIGYADQQKINIITGSVYKAKVDEKPILVAPPKNDSDRKKLETYLKLNGKWMGISTLDTFALQKIIEEGKWPLRLIKDIKQFMREDKSTRISFSKIKD